MTLLVFGVPGGSTLGAGMRCAIPWCGRAGFEVGNVFLQDVNQLELAYGTRGVSRASSRLKFARMKGVASTGSQHR
jgi:hypothetical protein